MHLKSVSLIAVYHSFGMKALVQDTVRRILICALALGLLMLCPGQLPLCSIFSSSMGDCATRTAGTLCDMTDMPSSPPAAIASQSQSCCTIAHAPLPEPRVRVLKVSVDLKLGVSPSPNAGAAKASDIASVPVFVDFSPPPSQSLLCSFLI
jgi:hypothetical protein